jgi:hypothetical protein
VTVREFWRRLEKGEGSWGAHVAVRGLGALLLALSIASGTWLCRSVARPPVHGVALLEMLAAVAVVAGWWFGTAFLVEGPGLFRLVPVPGRHGGFTL